MRGWSWISNNITTAYGFGIIQPPNGTSPTATVQNDTLTYTSSDSSITITGNAGTKTIDFVSNATVPGSNTQIIFNDSGVLSGSSTLTFNSLTSSLTTESIKANVQVSTTTFIGTEILDGSSLQSVQLDNRYLVATNSNVSIDWELGILQDPNTGNTTVHFADSHLYSTLYGVSVDWDAGQLLYSTATTVDWFNTLLKDPSGIDSINWTNRTLYDGGGVRSIEYGSGLRQLFDFGGSYPSVDFGNYGLFNIGITNSVPMLSWSVGDGGSVKIYNGYFNQVVGDFTNHQLLTSSAVLTLDWASRILYDSSTNASVDWGLYYLMFNSEIHVDWQNKTLQTNGGGGSVVSVDWGQFKCNNSGGFTSVDYGNHQLYDLVGGGAILSVDYNQRRLYDGSGSQTVLHWETQQSGDVATAMGVYGLVTSAFYDLGNIAGLGLGVDTWLATPSSANLAAAITDETGTGALVFATAPSLVGNVTLSSGQFLSPIATQSAPSYSFTGDADTGMFSGGADTVQLTVAGTARFAVNTSQFTATLPWR